MLLQIQPCVFNRFYFMLKFWKMKKRLVLLSSQTHSLQQYRNLDSNQD